MNLILLYVGCFFILSLTWNESFSKSVFPKRKTHPNFVPTIKQTFVTFSPEEATALDKNEKDLSKAALEYYSQHVNTSTKSIKVSSCYPTSHNGLTHVYLQQVLNGLEVVNGVGNINIDKDRKTRSMGNSFYTGKVPAAKTLAHKPSHTAEEAWTALAKFLNVKIEAVEYSPSVLKYIQNSSGHLRLVWDIRADTEDNMYNACVDAETLEVLQLVDWVSHATYNVFPIGTNDPSEGPRENVVVPRHPKGSPLGWNSQGFNRVSTQTMGNNVIAQDNDDGGSDYAKNKRPDGTPKLIFNFPLDLAKDPSKYKNAAITNLFYWNNLIHDIVYLRGFDEVAGNFQENNVGRGGKSKDAVIAFAQDGSGTDNAFFASPPDGQKGHMLMFVFTATHPRRDGDLTNDIIVHEYCHGLSNRLTGGPSNANCLATLEAGGMGEGWSDIIGEILRVKEGMNRTQDFKPGTYVLGGRGIRKFPYSTNLQTNPDLYSFTQSPDYQEVHDIGEIWAVIQYEIFWNLVEGHGFESDWLNPDPNSGGNILFLQLLIDGMKIQPCNPTFIQARNAILQADSVNNRGANSCALWAGFAKRGLGFNAGPRGVDNFDIPAECGP